MTFAFLVQAVRLAVRTQIYLFIDLQEAAAAAECSEPPVNHGPNSVQSLEFWHKLITLLVSVIEEDRTCYSSVLNQLVQFHAHLHLLA